MVDVYLSIPFFLIQVDIFPQVSFEPDYGVTYRKQAQKKDVRGRP